MWGDGKQTRSFMFIDDCVQGIQKIMDSDCEQPLNLGSDEMIDMNDFAKLVRSRRFEVLRCLHAIDATRLHQTRSWLLLFSILSPFGLI